jgi:hypothetical protein
MTNRLIRIGDALSQLINVTLLNGHPNESLSGRAWRTKSLWYKVIDLIFWFDKDHCKYSYLNDIKYAHDLITNSKKEPWNTKTLNNV